MRVLLLLFALVASGVTASQAQQAERIVVGLIGVYSGRLVPVESEQTKKTIIDTMSEINSGGGVLGKQLIVFTEDSQRDPRLARVIAGGLAARDKAQFVLIHGDPGCASEASSALQEYKVAHAAVVIGSPSPAAEARALLEAWVERVKAAGKFDLQ
jgi:ABC-type branched-subunit amino acid transport system substrate-binding protein